jgi:hypothetical protein
VRDAVCGPGLRSEAGVRSSVREGGRGRKPSATLAATTLALAAAAAKSAAAIAACVAAERVSTESPPPPLPPPSPRSIPIVPDSPLPWEHPVINFFLNACGREHSLSRHACSVSRAHFDRSRLF